MYLAVSLSVTNVGVAARGLHRFLRMYIFSVEAAQLTDFSLTGISTGFRSHWTAKGNSKKNLTSNVPRLSQHIHIVHTYQPLTVRLHAQCYAALQPTVLAAVPVELVDGALPRAPTRVHQVLPDAAFEEALTALAADGSIMTSWEAIDDRVRLENVCTCSWNTVKYNGIEFLPEALSPHITQYSTTALTIDWSALSVTNCQTNQHNVDIQNGGKHCNTSELIVTLQS